MVGGRDAALGETVGSSDPQQEPKCPLRGGVGGGRGSFSLLQSWVADESLSLC